ncbi:nuclear transport factor 2 family protein [Sphingomonas sp. NIBR02145]|uniref:nuclear transport factor 2 family protein n=1 Tax=Sphingomonas sp. NIBR02145 TaxID=3014784 RepID=UPI0022B2E58A|nr:nuclear transport factor 2 family protein [Sphingomonas sp. NIBR02145]WHU02942.1 nuclear transport factor 2 family protein [Sphingomonas sp. NIBR02145]
MMPCLTLALLLTTPAPQADAPLVELVGKFVEAERAYDQEKIANLVTQDYAEVSPLGDVDTHDEFLGFYAADKKRPVPVTRLSDPLVREYRDAASIIVRLSFDLPGAPAQPPRTVSMRASFLAVRAGGTWKIASAHYTPIRPPAPPAPPQPPAP